MGSPTEREDGSFLFHRGRYMLIAKEFYDFFPHLSATILNDSTALPFLVGDSQKIVYAQYVYHNSKHIDTAFVNGAPRDESRIYLNSDLDQNKKLFMPGDIVVMRRCQDNDILFYVLRIFRPFQSEYKFWATLLGNSTYEVCDLESAPSFSSSYTLPEQSASISSDKRVIDAVVQQLKQAIDTIDIPSNIEQSMGANLFNSRTFHDFVMNAYDNMCAVTKRVIACNGFDNLEAAHIMPQAHNGTFLPCNGIAMSRDMHCVFDKGFFTIEDDYTIVVHPDVLHTNSYLNSYNGDKITIPSVEYFRPLPKFLQYHRDNIYGTFRQIRSNWIFGC